MIISLRQAKAETGNDEKRRRGLGNVSREEEEV
jgi:hypothetical protein